MDKSTLVQLDTKATAPIAANIETKVHNDSRQGRSDADSEDTVDGEDILNDILAAPLEEWQYPEESTDTMCSQKESDELRQLLRQLGPEQFILATLVEGDYTALKLCSAFRVHVPGFTGEDESLYHLLGFALHRELSHRKRLPQHRTIDDAAKLLQSSKNILVITGAGISTSLGIPDFRSTNSGFYSKLRARGFEDPEALFTLEDFDHDPSGFYSLAGELVPVIGKWSPTHQFIRLLQNKNKLLRNYTQNIDNVESYAGIAEDKIIHCHGSWKTASCRKCKYQVPGSELFPYLDKQQVPLCKQCTTINLNQPTMKRKRNQQFGKTKPRKKNNEYGNGFDSLDDDDDVNDDIPTPGVMKPDITFFGEALPDKFYDTLNDSDRGLVDLVIVIGTSMKVAPVSEIPQYIKYDIPQILISRDPIHHIEFDMNFLGDCDTVVQELCRRAGWDFKHKMLNENEKIAVQPHADSSYAYRVTKQAVGMTASV